VATPRCKCGTLLRDDDPVFSGLFFAHRDFDVEVESAVLRGRAYEAWTCRTCGRIWIFWDRMSPQPTEYLRIDSDAELKSAGT
jgi:hypothetical protein